MRIKRMLIPLILLFLLPACNQKSSDESRMALIKTTNPDPTIIQSNTRKNLELVEDIKHDVASFQQIYDVAVVKGKKDTLVAYKVKHMSRFGMKNIEKQLTKKLNKKYPKENITVSSDYKIFIEAVDLKNYMESPEFSEKKADEKLKKIIKLQQELT